MQIHRDLKTLPNIINPVVTIGTFDGVHLGHQKIIRQIKEEANRINGESVVVTFHPHPRQVLSTSDKSLQLLNTLDEKILLLKKQGIDHLVIVSFTKTFSQLSAQEYIKDFLVGKFHPSVLIIGYDHHFGHNREGNINLLRQMGEKYRFQVKEIPAQVIHDLAISSTEIRKHLQQGEITLANELLGYPYFISGEVIHGDKRGKTLGFPTANIEPKDNHKLIPADGVYAAQLLIPSPLTSNRKIQSYGGALNIGHKPTFGGKEKRIEIFIFDFNDTIYGETIFLRLHEFIRPDKKFPNAEMLVAQMHEDVATIKNILINKK